MVLKRARRESHFSQIPNTTLRDTQLTDGAYRLLMYMLSMSDEWVFYNSVMSRDLHISKETLKRRIRELRSAGYISREQPRGAGGVFLPSDTVVFEVPQPQVKNDTSVDADLETFTGGQISVDGKMTP